MPSLISRQFTESSGAESVTKAAMVGAIPVGRTAETIKNGKYIEQNEQIRTLYSSLRPYLRLFCAQILKEALGNVTYDFDSYKTVIDAQAKEKEVKEGTPDGSPQKNGGKKNGAGSLEKTWKAAMVKNISAQIKSYAVEEYDFGYSEKFIFGSFLSWLENNGYQEQLAIMSKLKGGLVLFKPACSNVETSLFTKAPDRIYENFQLYIRNTSVLKRLAEEKNSFYTAHSDAVDIFNELQGYGRLLTPEGIRDYNQLFSGVYDENGSLVTVGYNGWANEQNQALKEAKSKTPKYKFGKKLYKQILMDEDKSFHIISLETDEECREQLENLATDSRQMLSDLGDFMRTIPENYGEMHVAGKWLWKFGMALFGDNGPLYGTLADGMKIQIELDETLRKAPAKKQKMIEGIGNYIAKQTYSLETLEHETGCDILQGMCETLGKMSGNTAKALEQFKKVCTAGGAVKDAELKKATAELCSTVTELRRLFACFVSSDDGETPGDVNAENMQDILKKLGKTENLLRNYMTRKEFDTSAARPVPQIFGSFKNLDTTWHASQEKYTRDRVEFFRHTEDGREKYYYGIILSNTDSMPPKNDGDMALRFSCTKLVKVMMSLPRFGFSTDPSPKKFFERNPSEELFVKKFKNGRQIVCTREVYEIYRDKTYTDSYQADDATKLANLHKLCAYYRDVLKNHHDFCANDWSGIEDVSRFNSYKQFQAEVEKASAHIDWTGVSFSQILEMADNGSMLLFELNKNGNTAKAKDSGYIQLVKAVMSGTNTGSVLMNSGALIKYRPALIQPKVAHHKGDIFIARSTRDGEKIPKELYRELDFYASGKLSRDLLSAEALKYADRLVECHFSRDIVYRERYARDAYFFCFSYEINHGADEWTKKSYDIQMLAMEECTGDRLISVVRGTEHLLSYVVMDGNKVVSSGNLDTINGRDYLHELKCATADKAERRKGWDYTRRADDIKEAYLEQAVNVLSRMAVENSARILIEDVSTAVRNRYAFLDAQFFGRVTDALVEKLRTYTVAGAEPDAPGGKLHPLNLAFGDSAYRNMGILVKQGSMRAVDPDSGFVNAVDVSELGFQSSVKNRREWLSKCNYIRWEGNVVTVGISFDRIPMRFAQAGKQKWEIRISGERTLKGKGGWYSYVGESAKIIKEHLIADGLALNPGDDIPVSSMSDETVCCIAGLLQSTICGRVNSCAEVSKTYSFSPITGKQYGDIMYELAKMQAGRYIYFRAGGEKTDGWLEQYQNQCNK